MPNRKKTPKAGLAAGTIALVTACTLLGACAAREQDAAAHATAELIRTEGGIVHVTSSDFAGLGYGLAYAYAQDNACMLADHLLTVRGERSKYFGPDAPATRSVHGEYSAQVQYTLGLKNADSDFFYRAYLDSAALARGYEAASPDARALVAGYVAGYNRWLAEHANALPQACRGAAWVRPMTLDDMRRMIAEKAIHASGEYFRNAVLAAAPPADTVRTGAIPTAQAPLAAADIGRARERWLAGLAATELGSNALAVGTSASENGRGMLLGNPHFPWFGPDRFYEAHLTVPGRYDAMGATLGGLPVVVIGFNRDIAWTHTVSTSKHFALFRLTLDADDATGTRYLLDGKWQRMTRRDVTIEVRQADGSLATRHRAFYATPFGVAIAAPSLGLPWDRRYAYVLSDVNRENVRMIDHWLAIGESASVDAVAAADARFVGMPWVNTIAADRAGKALFEDYSAVPNLSGAAATRGCLLEPKLFVLDGSRTACGASPGAEGIFAQQSHLMRRPHLARTDFVANSNDSYWLANPAAPITGLSPIFGTERTAQSLRTRYAYARIEARLGGSDGGHGQRFDFDALERLLFEPDVYAARLMKPGIVAACAAAPERTPELVRACDVLARWDGRADPTSRGAPLFRLLWQRLERTADLWAVPFDPASPMTTPRDLNPAAAPDVLAALRATVADMHAAGIPLDAALAPYQYTTVRDARIALGGGPGEDGLYNVISTGTKFDPHPFGEIESGSSYVQLVGFDANGPVAKALLTYGQSTDPASRYFGDQVRRFAAHQWIDLPYARGDVLAHAEGDIVRLSH
jgi:acyl-homoserine-lactone acylase